ncbi:unnamed protein product [Caenorhabditis nigoni]
MFGVTVKARGAILKEMVAGLPAVPKLSLNSRIMMRRNIDTSAGLVNGLTGVLEEFVKDGHGEIIKIGVRFDRYPNEVYYVRKYTPIYNFNKVTKRARTQFPITMAYVATIHKSQGLTLKNVVISTSNMFSLSQMYVDISRVKTLEGLHLLDFHPEKVIVEFHGVRATGKDVSVIITLLITTSI